MTAVQTAVDMRGSADSCGSCRSLTRGSSGREEKEGNEKGRENGGGEAGGNRQRADGGHKSKGRSAGWSVRQELLLLILCTIGGAGSGGSWGKLAPAGSEGVSLGDNRVGGCWRGGSWRQTRCAVAGGSWQ